MDRRSLLMLTGSVAASALASQAGRARADTPDDPGVARTTAIAAAATRFLDLLDPAQRAHVRFPFTPQPEATAVHFRGGLRGDVDMVGEQYSGSVWSNFPVSDVPRPGLRLGTLTPGQRAAAMDLLAAMLSANGMRKVRDIMGSDQALSDSGTPYASGRAVYTIAIFGEPGLSDLWMVQFGGHHLALNVTMRGGHGALAPVLTGCLPASYVENGEAKRALSDENDRAFALLATLDPAQRRQAIIDHPVSTLVLGPGHAGEQVAPVGVPGSALDPRQREMLFGLIREWAGIVNDTYAAPRLAAIRSGLPDTRFAWSGPETHQPNRNGASYFRIHGPDLFIEFAPQFPGGDLTMHVHTIYRTPSDAYGRALA